MSNDDRAEECFKSGFSCSRAVLSIYGQALGLGRDMPLKLVGALGGGMAGGGRWT